MNDWKQQLEQATGVAWAEYKARYPETAARIEQRVRNALSLSIASLERSAAYQQLLAATDSEVDKGNIIRAIGDVLIGVLPAILAAL